MKNLHKTNNTAIFWYQVAVCKGVWYHLNVSKIVKVKTFNRNKIKKK